MKGIPVSNVRNFAVVGHTSSGKTTLVDAILYKLGLNDRLGSVDAGSSLSDYTSEEKSRKLSLYATPFTATHKTGTGDTMELLMLDTPGYLDFFGQVVSAARAADTGLVVVDASSGVQVGTRRVWRCIQKQNLARAVVITGLDRDNTDYEKVLSDIRSSFGDECVPVLLPLPDGSGVVDILGAKDLPETVAGRVEEIKNALVEKAAETDDSLIEKFLDGESLSAQEIANGLRAAVASGGLVPVFACMPLKGIGIDELLEGIARLLPSPLDRPATDREGNEISPAADAPLTAFVWRTASDPFVGHLAFVRVLGGTLCGDSEAQNSTKDSKERIGSLLVINGKKQETVDEATAGDLVALTKLKTTTIGDTLCAAGLNIQCPDIALPAPVYFQAVTAKTQADEDKIGTALSRVAEEDATLRVSRNVDTHEIVLGGLGDVHIDVAVERMKSRSNVEVVLDTPKLPYRETVTGTGEGHYRHKKQSGGRGQYGEVYLRVEPKTDEEEDWFVNAIVGGAIPGNFVPAVQKGLVEGMTAGSVAGYPVTGIKVTLYDGTYHDVDSSEIAFKIAGSRALREGLSKASPVLLEPIMEVKISIPDQYLGDVNGDLNHKRGRIMGMGSEEGLQVITAEVPQAELFRYAAELRSMTQGQGTFTMEFARYDQVPANVAQKVVAETEREKEED